jgi:hypothetical protein
MPTVHVVNLILKKIDPSGNVIESNAPMQNHLNSSTEFRVEPEGSSPNSAGWPTLKRYLELEAAQSYEPKFINQSMIVTWKP